MSKESGGFLRKVARFVANPTTDWSDLDRQTTALHESDFAKSEIKAMIERKRRNDFVRKRELDMLRKIRREGLSPDAALALGTASNIDSDSRPQSGARSDVAVKAKIDEIELQMVGLGGRSPSPASQPPANPPRLTEVGTTTPGLLTTPGKLGRAAQPAVEPEPEISQAVLDMARATTPRMAGVAAAPVSAGALAAETEVQVAEVVHDPDLDEAVIAFANADFDQCERCLLDLVQSGAARHDDSDTWMVLFDLYRALDLPHKFDNLAVSFAQKFGMSAPQWYSLPDRVTDFLASKKAPAVEPTPGEPEAIAVLPGASTIEGWVAPATLDDEALADLRAAVLQLPRPWTLDWTGVTRVTTEGAVQLTQLMRNWAGEPLDMSWSGTETLLNVLAEAAPTGARDADPALWMLRLETLRLCNRPDTFDEVAIDYCITYELSPPSWEPAACRVRTLTDAISPHTMPLSHVGDVSTTFVESQHGLQDMDFVQIASLDLSGQLVGDIGPTLSQLDSQLGASVSLDIDCSHLLRVDFIAAGDLLNWVLARRAENRQVVFINPHRLVALFFGAMGINEHAKVKLQMV